MTQEPTQKTITCPLCQHTEFEPIELRFGGHTSVWFGPKPKGKGFRALFRIGKYGSTKAMRCINCHYVALFAID